MQMVILKPRVKKQKIYHKIFACPYCKTRRISMRALNIHIKKSHDGKSSMILDAQNRAFSINNNG